MKLKSYIETYHPSVVRSLPHLRVEVMLKWIGKPENSCAIAAPGIKPESDYLCSCSATPQRTNKERELLRHDGLKVMNNKLNKI